MTSKNLFFNLMREDLKRRVWTMALSMLAFVISLPIFTMLRIERTLESIEYSGIEEAYRYFASIANNQGIGLLFVTTIVGAFICGLSGFSYLYSKNKVDLYHSIPVKREKLFLVTFINGIIIYAVPYLINILLYFIIGAANNLLTKSAVSGAILAFCVNLIGYLFVYSITIIAVMMTGNLIVGLLGTAVFMLYGPSLLTIKLAICEMFLNTYYQPIDTQNQLNYISPFFAYNRLIGAIGESDFMIWLIGISVVTIIAIGIGVVLYKKRPSEAAGKSMAFKQTQGIIKILIVIPSAIVGGLLFMSMSESTSFMWMIFGIIFIGFLAHGIIEIIYNNDFKCLVSKKIQLVVCITAALIIVGAAKIDLFQYDSYIPNEAKVESMSVSFEGLDSNIDGYYELPEDALIENNNFKYVDSTTYKLSHMELTNFKVAYQLAQYAAENNLVDTEKRYEDNSEVYMSFTVKYTMKNRNKVYRNYTVKLMDIIGYVDALYADENYKEGVYQLLTMNRDIINSISYYNGADDVIEDLKLTPTQKQELIDIYVEELKTLTATEMIEEIPISQLMCQIGEVNSGVSQSYYIYPKFTNTINYLKSLGVNVDSSINPENIESILITDYNTKKESSVESTAVEEPSVEVTTVETYSDGKSYSEQLKEYEFTDREEIAAIAKAIVPERLTYGIVANTSIQRNLEVTIIYKYIGNSQNSACILIDKLPDNIRQKIGY